MNKIPCHLLVELKHSPNAGQDISMEHHIFPNENHMFKAIHSTDYNIVITSVEPHSLKTSFNCSSLPPHKETITARSMKANTILISLNSKGGIQLTKPSIFDHQEKSEKGHAFVR